MGEKTKNLERKVDDCEGIDEIGRKFGEFGGNLSG